MDDQKLNPDSGVETERWTIKSSIQMPEWKRRGGRSKAQSRFRIGIGEVDDQKLNPDAEHDEITETDEIDTFKRFSEKSASCNSEGVYVNSTCLSTTSS